MTTPIDKIAWIRLEDGKVLSTRSRGKDVYYFPGGKREPGETDLEAQVREIREEFDVAIAPGSALRPPARPRPARLTAQRPAPVPGWRRSGRTGFRSGRFSRFRVR